MAIDEDIEKPTAAAGEQNDISVEEEAARAWRPSRPAAHRFDQVADEQGAIVECAEGGGILGATARFLKRPFVRLIIGLAAFILAALLYDAFVNGGSWTIRPEALKPAKHAGSEPIPRTPD